MFNDEVLCAQVLIFMNAGTENISFTATMALYQIAKDPEIQRKLREEIDGVLAKQGSWTYQAIKDMVYMDQVLQGEEQFLPSLISETTRRKFIWNKTVNYASKKREP